MGGEVGGGLAGFQGDGSVDARLWEVEAVLGHQVFLLRNQEPGRWRELRLETEISGQREKYVERLVALGVPSATDTWRISTGLTYRNGWGLFRLVFVHSERSFDL